MRLSLRFYALSASATLILCAAAILVLRPRLEYDFRYHDLFCRWLYTCADQALTRKAFEQLRDGEPLASSQATFRAAVLRNEASPFHWADLGESYLAQGEIAKARQCFERSLALGPHVHVIRMRAATFYLRTGELKPAFEYMSGLLKQGHSHDDIILSYYSRMGLSVAEILANHGMPVDLRASNSWFYYLLAKGRTEDAALLWDWKCSQGLVNEAYALDYVRRLAERHLYDIAAHAWKAYRAAAPEGAANLLINGGFEKVPAGTLFDWAVNSSEQAQASQDCSAAQSGNCSLRIRFDAKENLDYRAISQTILIEPGRYRFEAYARAENLSTDQGVRFRVFDAENPGRLNVETEAVTGTTNWKALRQSFTVPPGARLLVIQVARTPSSRFDNRIKGTIWLDRVSIVPAGGS